MGLGDRVSKALSMVGITEQRVKKWLGSCRCSERQEKLNQLGFWAARTLRRSSEDEVASSRLKLQGIMEVE